jgi:hypothetical protein
MKVHNNLPRRKNNGKDKTEGGGSTVIGPGCTRDLYCLWKQIIKRRAY